MLYPTSPPAGRLSAWVNVCLVLRLFFPSAFLWRAMRVLPWIVAPGSSYHVSPCSSEFSPSSSADDSTTGLSGWTVVSIHTTLTSFELEYGTVFPVVSWITEGFAFGSLLPRSVLLRLLTSLMPMVFQPYYSSFPLLKLFYTLLGSPWRYSLRWTIDVNRALCVPSVICPSTAVGKTFWGDFPPFL